MLTKDLQRKVASLSGTKIPAYSIYQALRTLVKRRVAAATRVGRQFSYRLTGSPAPDRSARSDPAPAASSRVTSLMVPPLALLPHKLAPGEVTILHIGETHIETATNEHGKLVLERHARPR
ncbi:MAG: hypothetical protein L3K18_01390 [Thermoplasmata archaeon]|nr:hypothetical protein [Thermoplasmata archaeon]MCI4355782.1 hypothetical protein [Thermoplasmata archaeon]